MGHRKTATFCEYRYQILPVSQQIQMDLDGAITGLEDLKTKKNAIFRRAIENIRSFDYARSQVQHKLPFVDEDLLLLQLGAKRGLIRTNRDFTLEELENWPTVFVVFDNNPKVQKCLVQQGGGFQNTSTVVDILQENLNSILQHSQLSVAFEPIYRPQLFWELVSKYKGKITQIEFDLVSPNMSNISASLRIDLTSLNKTINTQRTRLQLNSDKNSCLTPTQGDLIVDSLVEYSSQGGGNISMRARGVHKKIQTSKGVNEFHIDDVTLKGASLKNIADTLRSLME